MAAPHVSGAAAAFLSVRGEFVGQAETVKTIFVQSSVGSQAPRRISGRGPHRPHESASIGLTGPHDLHHPISL